MSLGVLILFLVYPLIYWNENKYLNLVRTYEILENYLFIAKDTKTDKSNANKLVFVEG